MDDNNDVIMRLKVIKINTNNNFDDNYFEISEKSNDNKVEDSKKEKEDNVKTKDNNIKEENKTETTSKVEETLYPMYVPTDTYLDTQDVVSLDKGARTILTFSGDSPFTFVQSPVDNETVDYLKGDPTLVADSIGAVSDTSVAWISNDKEFYLTSTSINADELLMIADSLSVAEVGK